MSLWIVVRKDRSMDDLNENWVPGFGTIYTWFAMDKNGRLAMMVNNCFGDLPRQLLKVEGVEQLLDHMNEFVWEESVTFTNYPKVKSGGFSVDLYSASAWRSCSSREEVTECLLKERVRRGRYADANIPMSKGFYIYHGVEGSFPGEDYPVGCDEVTEMGDYFRYLAPDVFGGVEDFPEALRGGIAVSDFIDFSVDRILFGRHVNDYFPRLFSVR